MQVRVLFFARSRELAGTSEASLTLEPGSTTTVLLQQLLQQVRAAGLRGSTAHPRAAACRCRVLFVMRLALVPRTVTYG